MKIAVLAWGSLIQQPGELLINNRIGNNGWFTNGPHLPVEFSRISNGKRLTLVIDENGNDIQTQWALMESTDMNEAVSQLAIREQMHTNRNIGFIDLKSDTSSESSKDLTKRIKVWAIEHELDAVIWTGLRPNFREKIFELFNEDRLLSVSNIRWYFEKLEHDEYISAREYIMNAPRTTSTFFRKNIENIFATMVTDQVLVHEAGHILLAKAFQWDVDDIIQNQHGSPIIIKFAKLVNGNRTEGVIINKIDPAAIQANWERLVITQGGWAAEQLFHYKVGKQFKQDLDNAEILLRQLPEQTYDLVKAKAEANRIIRLNTSVLTTIRDELKERILNNSTINFEGAYPIRL